jgi:hypothetical protein
VVVASIARTYFWTPWDIDRLFLDDLDEYGLFFWYNDAKQMSDELRKK